MRSNIQSTAILHPKLLRPTADPYLPHQGRLKNPPKLPSFGDNVCLLGKLGNASEDGNFGNLNNSVPLVEGVGQPWESAIRETR